MKVFSKCNCLCLFVGQVLYLHDPLSFARFRFGLEGRKALNPTQSIYIQGRPRAAWAAKKEDFEIPFPILWKHIILVESPPLEQKGIFCCGQGLRLCRRRASQSGRTAGSLPAGAAGGWLDLDTSRKAPQDVAPEIFPLPRHCAGALPSAPSVSSKTFRADICFRCHLPVDQVAVKGTRNRANSVLEELHPLEEAAVVEANGAHDHVRMSVHVFCQTVV